LRDGSVEFAELLRGVDHRGDGTVFRYSPKNAIPRFRF